MISFSAPGKIHLLGEHTVVYGKPALLSAINLRVTVTLNPLVTQKSPVTLSEAKGIDDIFKKIIEPIIKKHFKIKTIPPYKIAITSHLPLGSGLGSSAAISSAYIACLLTFLKIKWDLKLINELTFEAEKVFHGNPSGGDNTTIVHGGLLIFQKGVASPTTSKIKSFVLIHSGKPLEKTKQMIEIAKPKIHSILEDQEYLTKQMVLALKDGNEKLLIEVIREGERNLEKIGVVGKIAKKIIGDIEDLGGAAKISGAGGVKKGSGMLLTYHEDPKKLLKYAKINNLNAFVIKLGAEGLRKEGFTTD